jgi:hypothetical protein
MNSPWISRDALGDTDYQQRPLTFATDLGTERGRPVAFGLVASVGHYSGRTAGAVQNIPQNDRDRAGAFSPFAVANPVVSLSGLLASKGFLSLLEYDAVPVGSR